MKLSPRETLLKEADSVLENIRFAIREREIKSQSDWDEFTKDEKLAALFTEKWFYQVKELAKKGRIKIDLRSLNQNDRMDAKHLLNRLDSEINKLETGNPYGFGELYILLKIITALIGIIGIGGNLIKYFESELDLNSKVEIEKSMELTKKFKQPPSVKTNTPKQILNWIKSVVSVIKK